MKFMFLYSKIHFHYVVCSW